MGNLKLVVLLVVSLFMQQINVGLAANKTITLTLKAAKEIKKGALADPSSGTITSPYIATITLGTDTTKEFKLLIDTGKTDTWIVDRFCPDPFCVQASTDRNFYEYAKSSTYVPTKKSVSLSYFYKKYQVSGTTGKERFTVSSQSITNQDFIRATSAKQFTSESYDGFLGLAYNPTIKSDTRFSLFENLVATGAVTSKIFSLIMKTDGSGKLLLGGTDTADYKADTQINYVSVLTKGIWDFKASLVTFGIEANPISLESKGARFRIETILPTIGVPSAKLKTIANNLGATLDKKTNTYVVNCLQLDAGPNLILTINGVQYPIPPTSFISSDEKETPTCTLTFSDQKNDWILGQSFLALYYTAYDATNQKVGFAEYRI